MEDIGKVLYERVKANFDRRCKDHYLIKTISKRIANGKADMIDLSSYAGSLGAQLANAILDEVTQDLLPDGRLYYNIAKSIIEPMLRGNYDLINSVADELQASLDRKLSYRIKAQHAPFPQERVNTAIGAACQEGIDWETVRRRMSSTPENITHSMADDYMKANAEFRSKAGIDTYIERRDDGKCCPWCSKLAGRYRYPEQVPRDVFRRHDNCGCLVSYVTPGGMRQNVHSKRGWNDEDQREYLKQLDEDKKRKREERKARWGDSYDKVRRERIVFSPKEAAEREKIVKEKIAEKRKMALTKGGKGDIINIDEKLKSIGFDKVDSSFFKNVNKDMQSAITDQLTLLEEKFKAISKSNKPTISADLKGGSTACVRSELDNPENQKLMLSSRQFKNRKRHIEDRRKDVESFFCMPCNTDDETLSRYVVTHEYGHMLENSIAAQDMKGTINTFPRLTERYREQIEKIARTIDADYDKNKSKYLSMYVREKTSYGNKDLEFFAECFANSQLGQPNVLGQAMLQWLEKRDFNVL